MFKRQPIYLQADLETNDTLTLGILDKVTLRDSGHRLFADGVRYDANTDFTVVADSNTGEGTLTWLHATTLDENSTILLAIAFIDSISSSDGSGGGDATAAKQDAQTALLTTLVGVATSPDPAEVVLANSTPYFNGAVGATLVAVGSGGQVLTDYFLENPHAETKAYLQFFNAASTGDVTLGTTPPVRSIGLGGGKQANLAGLALTFPLGLVIAATSTASGSGAPASDLVVNLGYRTA